MLCSLRFKLMPNADIDVERHISDRMAQLTRDGIMSMVRSLRMGWGFTQHEAAAFLQNVATNTWQRWENGNARPQDHHLHMLIWLELLMQQGNPLLLKEIIRVKRIRREKKKRADKDRAELKELRFDLYVQMKRSVSGGSFAISESTMVH